jgi:DNA polymerase-3 subunit delta'
MLVHPASQKQLDMIMRDMPQSLLISGKKGVGLYTIARSITGRELAAEIRPQNAKEQVDDENGTISVEMIRKLDTMTRAKQKKRQVIIIDDADRMSAGAQAAFLKLLEEPFEHIHFILTSHSSERLLPTIRSRVQEITIQPLTREQSIEHMKTLAITDTTKQAQLQFIAGGLPAEMTRLAGDEMLFAARAEIMGDARSFLQKSTYEKLLVVNKYQSDRTKALQLIESAENILRRTMTAQPQQGLVAKLEMLLDIYENISRQYNIRLQLTRFVL